MSLYYRMLNNMHCPVHLRAGCFTILLPECVHCHGVVQEAASPHLFDLYCFFPGSVSCPFCFQSWIGRNYVDPNEQNYPEEQFRSFLPDNSGTNLLLRPGSVFCLAEYANACGLSKAMPGYCSLFRLNFHVIIL